MAPSVRDAWLAAERWQETGSPAGDYGYAQPGCYGAYCWNAPSNWADDCNAAGYGQYAASLPSEVPDAIQDAVAWSIMGPYVERGEYAQAAEVWNGGVPYSVPNPVLGSSGVYAQEVISKFDQLVHGDVPTPASGASTSAGGTKPDIKKYTFNTQGAIDTIEHDDWSGWLEWGTGTMHVRAHSGYLWSHIALRNCYDTHVFTTTGGH